jgi:hypothetical protein
MGEPLYQGGRAGGQREGERGPRAARPVAARCCSGERRAEISYYLKRGNGYYHIEIEMCIASCEQGSKRKRASARRRGAPATSY